MMKKAKKLIRRTLSYKYLLVIIIVVGIPLLVLVLNEIKVANKSEALINRQIQLPAGCDKVPVCEDSKIPRKNGFQVASVGWRDCTKSCDELNNLNEDHDPANVYKYSCYDPSRSLFVCYIDPDNKKPEYPLYEPLIKTSVLGTTGREYPYCSAYKELYLPKSGNYVEKVFWKNGSIAFTDPLFPGRTVSEVTCKEWLPEAVFGCISYDYKNNNFSQNCYSHIHAGYFYSSNANFEETYKTEAGLSSGPYDCNKIFNFIGINPTYCQTYSAALPAFDLNEAENTCDILSRKNSKYYFACQIPPDYSPSTETNIEKFNCCEAPPFLIP